MLSGLGPLGGVDCCGGLVVASGVRCTVLPLLLLHGCSAAVPLPKSSILRSSLFCRKLGFRFFFFFGSGLEIPCFFPFYYMCVLP